jgi:glycosyltransferase involved in cell wall biosynthesis
MKVSIITAVRNGANDIGVTLDSVNEQDYADLEHVIVDGASTDATMFPSVTRVYTMPSTRV